MQSLFEIPVSKPFDPASLKVEVKNTTIGQLKEMLSKNLIDLQPDFQRHGNLWGNPRKSRLIESIILGLPLPSFYFYIDETEKKWVVIDGLQRLCAIKDFMVDKKLKLVGLQFLGDLHTKHDYDDFSYYEQLDMSMRSVTLNVISGTASTEAKYIIFQRINSEATQLSSAEIRNALFHGKSMKMVKELAESKEFDSATNYSVSKKRLRHYDFISRFLAFYILGYNSYSNNKMDLFIGTALDAINSENDENKVDGLREVFYSSLAICYSLLGNDAFRQPLSNNDKKNNPVSITLFESMMYSIAKLNSSQRQRVLLRKACYVTKYKEMFQDEFLRKELSRSTNSYKSVNYRFSKMEELVEVVLK